MATSLTSTGITFPDATTQTTAATGRSGVTNTTTGSNITLTSSSNQVQNIKFTATGLYVILPNATTMAGGTDMFIIKNIGQIPVVVKDAAGNVLLNVIGTAHLSLLDKSTSAGVWSADDVPLVFGVSSLSANINTSGIGAVGNQSIVLLSETTGVVSVTAGSGVVLRAFTISGGVVTFGTAVSVPSWVTSIQYRNPLLRLSSTTGIFSQGDFVSSLFGWVFTVSGTTITVGSRTTIATVSAYGAYATLARIDDTRFVLAAPNSTSSTTMQLRAGSVSGTTITLGTAVTLSVINSGYISNYVGVTYNGTGVVALPQSNSAVPFTVSGTTITTGTSYAMPYAASALTNSYASNYPYADSTEPNRVYLFGRIFDCSGNSITAGYVVDTTFVSQGAQYRNSAGTVKRVDAYYGMNTLTSIPVAGDTRYATPQTGIAVGGFASASNSLGNNQFYMSKYIFDSDQNAPQTLDIYNGVFVRLVTNGSLDYSTNTSDVKIEVLNVLN